MLTDLDIFWQYSWHPFEHTDHDRTEYAVYAIVIDNEVVDVRPYKKSFIDLFNNNNFIEESFLNGKYKINAINNNNSIVNTLELSEGLGAMFLSEPIIVLVTKETSYASPGMKYENQQIIK